MAEHRSLDEFATAAPADGEDPDPDPTEIDALVRTYRSDPDGRTCTGCGETTTVFWTDDGRMVCPDCKDW